MGEDIKVVIADDHPMLLSGLNQTLLKSGIKVLGSAKDGAVALQMIVDFQPDLAILDIDMPYFSGFSIAEECKKRGFNTKVILLSYHKESEFIAQAKALHISGYLLKEDTSLEIMHCIHSVMNGESYFSKSIGSASLQFANDNMQKLANLSPSEKKILKLVALSLSSHEIADRLYVSERTIEKHRSNIIAKLGLAGQSHGLSIWAVEQKSIINSL